MTRAYAALADGGYAEARQGSGTFTRRAGWPRARARPGAAARARATGTRSTSTARPPPRRPGLAAAYVDAVAELPAYLGGHGYFPAGLPRLQEAIAATYDARGLPTDPEQIMVTPGALSRGRRSWRRR